MGKFPSYDRLAQALFSCPLEQKELAELLSKLRQQGVPEVMIFHSVSKHLAPHELNFLVNQGNLFSPQPRDDLLPWYQPSVHAHLLAQKNNFIYPQRMVEVEFSLAWEAYIGTLKFTPVSPQDFQENPLGKISKFQQNPEGVLSLARWNSGEPLPPWIQSADFKTHPPLSPIHPRGSNPGWFNTIHTCTDLQYRGIMASCLRELTRMEKNQGLSPENYELFRHHSQKLLGDSLNPALQTQCLVESPSAQRSVPCRRPSAQGIQEENFSPRGLAQYRKASVVVDEFLSDHPKFKFRSHEVVQMVIKDSTSIVDHMARGPGKKSSSSWTEVD